MVFWFIVDVGDMFCTTKVDGVEVISPKINASHPVWVDEEAHLYWVLCFVDFSYLVDVSEASCLEISLYSDRTISKSQLVCIFVGLI